MYQNTLYNKVISIENLILAWKKARKGKTKKLYVMEFEDNLFFNLMALHYELKSGTYIPKPLETFVLRDPKTRKISKSDFRDRIVHHALVNVIEPLFDKSFINDSCANRVGKGTSYALKRFEKFQRKVTKNFTKEAFCLKADIEHYFLEINHDILMGIINKRIKDEGIMALIKKIVENSVRRERERDATARVWSVCKDAREFFNKGMPLGNLTSQFFANVYLNELDQFVKHKLKAKFYVRYVDDFVILHEDKDLLIH